MVYSNLLKVQVHQWNVRPRSNLSRQMRSRQMHIKQENVLPRFWDNCFHNALLLLLIVNLCAAIIAKISHMTQQIVQKGQNWGQGINTKYVPFSKLTGGTCHRRYWMTGMFHLPPPSTHCLGTWPVPMPVLKATSWDVTCSDACAESHLCLYFVYAKPFCSCGIWRTITHILAVSDILQEKKYIYMVQLFFRRTAS